MNDDITKRLADALRAMTDNWFMDEGEIDNPDILYENARDALRSYDLQRTEG